MAAALVLSPIPKSLVPMGASGAWPGAISTGSWSCPGLHHLLLPFGPGAWDRSSSLNYLRLPNEQLAPCQTLATTWCWGMRAAQLSCHKRGVWGAWGDSALPKGAQLHHVVLLESLWGFGPKAEQLRCSWLCREREREGVKSKCCQHPPPHVPSPGSLSHSRGEAGAHLDDADGFSGEVVAGVGEEGQHQSQSPIAGGGSKQRAQGLWDWGLFFWIGDLNQHS